MTGDEEPVLRVVRGEPSDVELAAVTAVLLARTRGGDGAPQSTSQVSRWSHGAGVRRPLPSPGPGAWLAAGRR